VNCLTKLKKLDFLTKRACMLTDFYVKNSGKSKWRVYARSRDPLSSPVQWRIKWFFRQDLNSLWARPILYCKLCNVNLSHIPQMYNLKYANKPTLLYQIICSVILITSSVELPVNCHFCCMCDYCVIERKAREECRRPPAWMVL